MTPFVEFVKIRGWFPRLPISALEYGQTGVCDPSTSWGSYGSRRTSGQMDQSVVEGKPYQFRSGLQVELAHNAGPMGFDRSPRNAEFFSNLRIGVPIGQQRADFLFPGGQEAQPAILAVRPVPHA